MTLEETLIKLGLNLKEAKLYLAALELGPATILEISKKAGVKRPTAYVLLDSLVGQGYFSKSQKNKRALYMAATPDVLVRSLKQHEEILGEALPMLQAIMSSTKERPRVSIFESEAGMRQVYEEFSQQVEIDFFGSIKAVSANFGQTLHKFKNVAKQRNIKVRDLINNQSADIAYGKEVASDYYQVRLLPPELNFTIDAAIYGNKVAIMAIKKDLFAVVIESAEVANSLRALYQLAWSMAMLLK